MKKRFNFFLLLVLAGGLCSACWKTTSVEPPPFTGVSNTKTGYKPIYMATELAYKVAVQSPHALRNPGKIYIKDNYLFVNEIGKGIHVFNNLDKRNPIPLAFISIPGNVDIAVKGTTLYADNLTDMVAIDITSPNSAKVVKRLPNMFPYAVTGYPSATNTYFECVDQTKGTVIGWEQMALDSKALPNCFRN
ncbi:MAG: hypothetical protein ACOVOW_01945 [Spirosomataceae bacterium]|jgi:hypothetical protein